MINSSTKTTLKFLAAGLAAAAIVMTADTTLAEFIDAVLRRLRIADRFAVVRSAETEPWGKPHPAIFLTTAAALAVPPTACLVFEDSLPGLIAAKAARMACVCVPESCPDHDPRFVLADACLPSLEAVSDALLGA